MPSAEELEEKAEHYRTVTAPSLLEELRNGGRWSALSVKARAELADINFGLTDEEYEKIVGHGSERPDRYEKLCKVMGWLITDGTVMMYTPGEVLRDHSSGWPGLTSPEETRPLLDLLASDNDEDFQLLKRSLEEMLGRTSSPFVE